MATIELVPGATLWNFTLMERAEPRKGRSYWRCRCNCGEICEVEAGHLKSGHTKSCGCLRSKKSKLASGMRFGKLTLPKELPKRNRSRYWLCQCDCGNQCEVAEKHLNENGTKSCGCLSRRAEPHTIGMRFGKLTLLEELPKRNGGRYWLCRCDCGNQCEVAAKHLNENGTKSCGCLFDELAAEKQTDLTGRRFGRLTVLERLYRRGNHTYWRCRCDCGQEIKASLTNLYHGYVMSCGCLHAEQAKINMRNNIHFVQDTCVEKIACQREMVTNTSGHRGVRQVESGNWRAFLTFQKKRHNLGTYKTFEEAVAARLEGEEIYFKTFLDNYYAKQKA